MKLATSAGCENIGTWLEGRTRVFAPSLTAESRSSEQHLIVLAVDKPRGFILPCRFLDFVVVRCGNIGALKAIQEFDFVRGKVLREKLLEPFESERHTIRPIEFISPAPGAAGYPFHHSLKD
jgi:hypothetical protein